MLEKLVEIQQQALDALDGIDSMEALQDWKVNYLGRSSPLMQTFSQMGKVSAEERPVLGRRANEVKQALEAALDQRTQALEAAALAHSLQAERLDVSLPGRPQARGHLHPSTQSIRRMLAILSEMGFQPYLAPEAELDEINFQMLNIPPHHPAREMQDTFYLADMDGEQTNSMLLRTHTSPGQMHSMRAMSSAYPENPPEIRVSLPGMCYRFEQISARYESQFNQIELLAVGRTITFSDLKGTLTEFARRLFGLNVKTRFRASHFPFTEPSAEMDVECFVCGGSGCSICKRTGWLEILGCGMVHPVVLRNGGYDPEKYSGFAAGMGSERSAILLHRIDDIRHFWSNDLRFLEQF